MSSLKTTIARLAADFAASILEAIRAASLEEILAETGGRGKMRALLAEGNAGRAPRGRLGRRSAKDIAAVADSIIALLERNPEGLRAEQIREELGLEARELTRPIAEALASRRMTKEGQKRATTYFARAGGSAKSAGKRGKRAAGKRGKRGAAAQKKGKRGAGAHAANGAAIDAVN